MTNEEKLMLLRVQLYTAAQQLHGAEAISFFDLLREVLAANAGFESDARKSIRPKRS